MEMVMGTSICHRSLNIILENLPHTSIHNEELVEYADNSFELILSLPDAYKHACPIEGLPGQSGGGGPEAETYASIAGSEG